MESVSRAFRRGSGWGTQICRRCCPAKAILHFQTASRFLLKIISPRPFPARANVLVMSGTLSVGIAAAANQGVHDVPFRVVRRAGLQIFRNVFRQKKIR